LTRAEQEAETAARRLMGQIEQALAAVAIRDEASELEATPDRIERAARDLATALRELSEERSVAAAEDDR
jgi:hypothetical protein